MKNAASKAIGSANWDAAWTKYIAAKKQGDTGGAVRAARLMKNLHVEAGARIPAWLSDAAESE